VFIGLGVRQVRLTGGEPLLRRSLVDLVAGIAALEPRPVIAMTPMALAWTALLRRWPQRAWTGSM